MTHIRNAQMRMLVSMEIKQFFLHRRSRHFIPLAGLGIWLVLWPYFASPFIPVIVVLFAGLEPQFNNIFFRTHNELEALSVLPTNWQRIVAAKNVATIMIVCMMFPIIAATLLYFSPFPVSSSSFANAILCILSIIFPLLHVGNLRSVQHPRRITGWQVDDLAGVIEILVSTAIFSIPFIILTVGLHVSVLCIAYCVATVIFWWRYSLPKTAQLIESGKTTICLTT